MSSSSTTTDADRIDPIHPGEVLMEDFIEGFGITQNKLATAIAKLEKDVGIEDLVSVAMAMTSWMRSSDPERAKELSNLFNAYIQDVTGGAKR